MSDCPHGDVCHWIGLQAVVVNVDMTALLEDHFDLEAAAPFVFDNATMEQTATAVDRGDAGAAARQANRHVNKAVASRIDDLQDSLDWGAAAARTGLLHEQLVRFVVKARFVTARSRWFWSTAAWFQILVRGGRLACGYEHDSRN